MSSDIKPYLPPQPSQFKVVITTRLKLDLASSLFLSVLSETDALLLLAQLIGEEKQNQELAQALELCRRLGYLPLALQLVGRYVKKRKITLAELLRQLEEKGLADPSLIVNKNDPTWTLNVERGVEAAFELSWSELSEPSQQLGCLLSLFALAPIPWSLVKSVAAHKSKEVIPIGLKILQRVGLFKRQLPVKQEPKTLEDARVELENLHLLEGEDTYQVHQLIQEFLRNKQNNLVNASEQKDNFCKVLVEVAQSIPQTTTLIEIAKASLAIPHIAEAATVYQDWLIDENLIWPFVGLGRFYEGQGAYTQALPWREQCLSTVKKRLGESHPDVATSLNNLAGLYDSQGRYAEAEPLYQQALEIASKTLGVDHPNTTTIRENLKYLRDNYA